MHTTALIVVALVPVVLLLALGVALRRWLIRSDEFWTQAERLSYFVLLPALFLYGLATADTRDLPVADLALVLVVSTVVVAALVVLARPLLRIEGATFTSVFQGSVRFNNYIGVTVAAGLFGADGIALAAVCNGIIVPMVNVLCVLAFARFGATRLGPLATLRQVVTNPLIVACVVGIALQVTGLGLPPGIGPTLQALGGASMPLGLLCVGAALSFGAVGGRLGSIAFASVGKFVVLPAATFAMVLATGLAGRALVVAMLFQALPTASSSYVLARRLGGDAPLMAAVVAVQTVLGLAAVPLVLAVTLPG